MSWLSRKLDQAKAEMQRIRAETANVSSAKERGSSVGPPPGAVGATGFDCTLCEGKRVRFKSLELLQQHYLDAHTSETDEPPACVPAEQRVEATTLSDAAVATTTINTNAASDAVVATANGAGDAEAASVRPSFPAPLRTSARERGAREVVRLEGELERLGAELAEAEAALKEEKWYSQSLKEELAKYSGGDGGGGGGGDLISFGEDSSGGGGGGASDGETSTSQVAELRARLVSAEERLSTKSQQASELAVELQQRPHLSELSAAESRASDAEAKLAAALAAQAEVTSTANAHAEALEVARTKNERLASELESLRASAASDLAAAQRLGEDASKRAKDLSDRLAKAEAAAAAVAVANTATSSDNDGNAAGTTAAAAAASAAAQAEAAVRQETLEAQVAELQEKVRVAEAASAVAASSATDLVAVRESLHAAEARAKAAEAAAAGAADAGAQQQQQLIRQLADAERTLRTKTEEHDAYVGRVTRERQGLQEREAAAKTREAEALASADALEKQLGAATQMAEERGAAVAAAAEELREAREETKSMQAKVGQQIGLLDESAAEASRLTELLKEKSALEMEVAKRLEAQEKVTATLQAAVATAQEKLALPCEQCKSYEVQLVTFAEEAETGKLASARARKTVEIAEAETKEARAEVLRWKDEVAQKLQELADAKSQLLQKQEELQQTKQLLESRVIDLDTDLGKQQSIIDAGLQREGELKAQISSLEERVAEGETERVALEEQMGTQAQRLNEALSSSSEMEAVLSETKQLFVSKKMEVQQQLATTEESLTRVTSRLKDETALRTSLEVDVNALRQQYDRELAQRREVEQTLSDTKRRLGEELETTHAMLAATQAQLGDAEVRAASLESEKHSLLRDKEILESSVKALNAEKSGLLESILENEEKAKALRRGSATLEKRLHDQQLVMQELAADHSKTQQLALEEKTRKWERDKEVKNCANCDTKFSAAKRKHHCRNCGKIFCKSCSSHKFTLAVSKDPVRVCDPCFGELRNA